MKKILVIAMLLTAIGSQAQSEKYIKTMEGRVAALDTTRDRSGLVELANAFERIAEAEKNQWLPYYYAALANLNAGFTLTNGGMQGGLAETLDPYADKAEALLNKAEALSSNNSEIYIIKKMVATLRLLGDPMARYMKYGPAAAQALATAKKLNPSNPRVLLLEGQDKLFTPEEYGGSKTEARKLLEEALKKFDEFKPESSIAPNWGRNMTQYFLSQAK
jgi:hypothetical protein